MLKLQATCYITTDLFLVLERLLTCSLDFPKSGSSLLVVVYFFKMCFVSCLVADVMVGMGFNLEEIQESLAKMKYDEITATYLLLGRKASEVQVFGFGTGFVSSLRPLLLLLQLKALFIHSHS